ncbi:MAG: heparinase II/III family protein [Pseudomonadota bacterium]|nr:heparinase II/III family protein [Pseudomonadota bacterium]
MIRHRRSRWLFRPAMVAMVLLAAATATPSGATGFDPHQSPPRQPRALDDWITTTSRKEMRAFPEDQAILLENPPAFGWRASRTAYSFELRIDRDGREVQRFFLTRNIFRPNVALPPGDYTWQVRQLDQGGQATTRDPSGGWSQPRAFRLAGDGVTRRLADIWTAFEAAEQRARPRALPATARPAANNRGELPPGIAPVAGVIHARWLADDGRIAPIAEEPSGRIDAPGLVQSRKLRAELRQVTRRLNDSLAIAVLFRNHPQGKEARERALRFLDRLIAVDAFGRSGHAGDDLLNIRIARDMARAFDIVYRDLEGPRKVAVQRHIEDRTQAAFDFFILNERGNLGQFALSSHGFQIATHILAIATLMAGESDRASLWFREIYPLIATIVTPWGGEDGGYSNGINYGVWEFVNHIDSWDIIHNAIGFPYFEAPWVRNFIHFLAWFVPPGVAHAGFGDGGEKLRPALWAEIARVYDERGAGPVAGRQFTGWENWLRRAGTGAEGRPDGDDETGAEGLHNALLWPRLFGTAQAEAPTGPEVLPEAAIFPDIGWGAIHSDVGDPARWSVFFKSSPFGSFSHSHADQNSFMVMGHGRPLLIDSGYYDGYRSPHHEGWTRRTRAHNAITHDGGKGQPIDDPAAYGRLTEYWRCAGAVAMTGEAAAAYGGDITVARRSILWLPDGHLLVHDRMRADSAKRWEWNIHAAVPFLQGPGGTISVENGPASATLRVLAGPALDFAATDRFDVPPDTRLTGGPVPQQYHGTFTVKAPAKGLDMLVLVTTGDAPAGVPVAAKAEGDGSFGFRIGDWQGRIGGAATEARRAGEPAGDCAVEPQAAPRTATRLRFGGG